MSRTAKLPAQTADLVAEGSLMVNNPFIVNVGVDVERGWESGGNVEIVDG